MVTYTHTLMLGSSQCFCCQSTSVSCQDFSSKGYSLEAGQLARHFVVKVTLLVDTFLRTMHNCLELGEFFCSVSCNTSSYSSWWCAC